MALRLNQIATSVLSALEDDYAGMPECNDGQNEAWRRHFASTDRAHVLYDRTLLEHMNRRLACLHDNNLRFEAGPNCSFVPQTCGFSTRRLGEELLVTHVQHDHRLQPGDAIIAINGSTLDERAAQGLGNPFEGVPFERQSWDTEIAQATHILVRKIDGSEKNLKVRLFAADTQPAPCAFSILPDDSAYLLVSQLDSTEAAELLRANAKQAKQAPRLIIDVRHCMGGNEANAYPLLDWLFDEATNLTELQQPEEILTNYTVANCDRRELQIQQLRTLAAAQPELFDEQTLAWMDDNLATVHKMRGQGMVRETISPEDRAIAAGPAGQRVALLTDVTCADAAEWLARIAGASHRVTLVGRATAGNLDYSNSLSIAYDDRFVFVYPMSKTLTAAQGHGMRGRGVEPDITVTFTRQECTEDLVLARAIEALQA